MTERWLRGVALGSVRRLAVSKSLALQGHGPIRCVLDPIRSRASRFVGRYEFLVAMVLLFGVVYLPIEIGFLVFAETKASGQWLRTTWQVVAATLALSLTIMVFALEIFGRTGAVRYGGTLNAFAERVGLISAFRLGVIALVVDGAVLAGIGHGAPGGWAALVACTVSAAAIFNLPFVLTRVLRETGENQARKARTTAIRKAITKSVRSQVIETLCDSELQRLAEEDGFDVQAFMAPDILPGEVVIKAENEGTVQDVKVRKLVKVAQTLEEQGRVSLRIRVGSHVEEGSTLLVLPRGAPGNVISVAQKIVRCGERAPDDLVDHLAQLHDDALEAIRYGRPAAYDDIADTYVAALMEFPAAWATYKQEYDASIASGLSVIPTGPVSQVQRSLYEEMTLAAEGNREIMFEAAALPIRIVRQAMDVRASGLLPKMLALYPQMYTIGASTPGEVSSLLKERSWIHLKEILRYPIRPRIESLSKEARSQAIEDARQVYKHFVTLLRFAVDGADVDGLTKADDAWEESLRFLGFVDADPSELEYLEAELARGIDVQDELDAARSNLAISTAIKSLAEFRSAARLSLLAWVRHKSESLDETDSIEMINCLARRFGSVASVANATAKALALETENRHADLISDWILYEEGEGVHTISSDSHLLAAFAATSLLQIRSGSPVPQIEAASWLAQYEDQIKQELKRIAADPRLLNIATTDATERAALLADAIASAASRWREHEAAEVRNAPLHQPYVDEFEKMALDAMNDSRLVPKLLDYRDAVVHEEKPPPDPDNLALETFLPKELFIENERMLGRDWTARDFGQSIAFLETQRFLQVLASNGKPVDAENDFNAAVRSTISTMEIEGYSPSIAFFPVNFRLLRELNLPYGANAVPLPTGLDLGESARSGFRGLIEDVAVFQSPDVPDDRLCIIDLEASSIAHVWQVDRSDQMHVAAIEEQLAGEIIARSGNTTSAEPESSQVLDLMSQVRVTACLDVTFELNDQGAVRWVEIPADLRRE